MHKQELMELIDMGQGSRRGSTPSVQLPSEASDEEGKPLPPHLQSEYAAVTKVHTPHRPRSKRIQTSDGAV